MRVHLSVRRAVPALVLASVLAACGGGDGGEDDGGSGEAEGVTTAEFCEAYDAVATSTGFEDTQKAIADMADIGLPEEASDEAVEGFDILAGIAAEAKDDAEATELGAEIDAEGQAKVQEFFTYSTGACEAAPEDGESGDGGDSEEPTEEPTE